MYVDSCTYTADGKQYTRHLLRESFRKNGKVAHRTLANLSHCSEAEIRAIKLALKHKHNLQQLGHINRAIAPKNTKYLRLSQGSWCSNQRVFVCRAGFLSKCLA